MRRWITQLDASEERTLESYNANMHQLEGYEPKQSRTLDSAVKTLEEFAASILGLVCCCTSWSYSRNFANYSSRLGNCHHLLMIVEEEERDEQVQVVAACKAEDGGHYFSLFSRRSPMPCKVGRGKHIDIYYLPSALNNYICCCRCVSFFN